MKLPDQLRDAREIRRPLEPSPLEVARRYLERVSERWDVALGRLAARVESDE